VVLLAFVSASQPSEANRLSAGLLPSPAIATPEGSAVAAAAPAAPAAEPYFPFLAGEDGTASVSVGDTSHGFVVNAVQVTQSERLGILPPQRARGLDYGTAELVGMIEHAAARLHEATQTRLWIGNIGARGGGDIPFSVSHNSGRDGDIAFCYVDWKQRPVDPPDMVVLNGQGQAPKHGLRLDVPRTWIVVKALLEYPRAQVQYLFIAGGLKTLLLAHAREIGESPALIERAAATMRTPVGSAPHNDHMHLRVHCSERDVLGGCRHTGAAHPWSKLHDAAKQIKKTAIAATLGQPSADQRKRTVERLVLLDAREHRRPIATRLDDQASVVRAAAARAMAALGGRQDVKRLSKRFDQEPDVGVLVAIVEAIGSLGGSTAGTFLGRAVGQPQRDMGRLLPVLEAAAAVRGPAGLGLLPDTLGAVARGWRTVRQVEPAAGIDELGHALLDDPLAAMLWDRPPSDPARQVQLAAITAASGSRRLEPVPALIELLEDRSAEIRAQAGRALRMITNLSYGVSWSSAALADRDKGLARWRAAWKRSRGAPRDSWLLTGFKAAGYKVPRFTQKHTWELVRAVAGADHISSNAQDVLVRLLDHRPPRRSWSKGDACIYWHRWLKLRRERYRLDKPPAKTTRACYNPTP